MANYLKYFSSLRKRGQRLPIFHRIAIGNSLIIILGAVGGTLLTRQLAGVAADMWLIILFATVGIVLSLIINFWIIKTALRPLYNLRILVDRLQVGQADLDIRFLTNTDPDVSQLAAAVSSMVSQLEDRHLKLRALSKRAINVQEEERKRIARSLHDDTGQALSSLIISLERLKNRPPEDASEVQANLEAACRLATTTLKELRKIIYGLRPTMLDDLGLVSAIRWYARSNLEAVGIRVTVQAPDEFMELDAQVKTTLFRIAQEAIHNIVRHAKAESVVISLGQNRKNICMLIADNGRGFDAAAIAQQAPLQRLGLLGIQERADLVGGEVSVESDLGHGTRLRVIIHLQQKPERGPGRAFP